MTERIYWNDYPFFCLNRKQHATHGLLCPIMWKQEVKKVLLCGQDCIKSDQRILGESDFVMEVLKEANETVMITM